LYGHSAARRQRYRCAPIDGKRHAFTPPLPREHVDPDHATCAHCEERRGIHHGETAIARRHRWPTRVVARGLDQLASGTSYAKVSRWALRVAEVPVTKPRRAAPPPSPTPLTPAEEAKRKKRRRSRSALESRRAWRIAANWVEAFSSVIWTPVDERLRGAAQVERARLDALIAAGEPLDRPQVILIDDSPVWGREGRTKRRDGGFHLLIVGEVAWEQPNVGESLPVARTHLRLVRAMAKSNTPAWRLVFDELGYVPDFVVADAGTGIGAAVRAHFDPERTHFIPSLWHVRKSIRRSLRLEAVNSYNAPIERHLDALARDGAAFGSADEWRGWWDHLEVVVRGQGLALDKAIGQRRNYEPPFIAALPYLLAYPSLPMSTGGLETLIREEVDRVLILRSQFGNIERTNALFDLVVARSHHAFDDLATVARHLRADAEPHGGWTVALRSIDDPQPEKGRYSSLRDTTLLGSLAASRGVA